jgi:hypothetical protein
LGIAAWLKQETLPLRPAQFFLAALVLTLILGTIVQGGIALPILVVNSVCLVRMFKLQRGFAKLEPPPTGVAAFAYRIQRIYLAVCIGLVPVSYARLILQKLAR